MPSARKKITAKSTGRPVKPLEILDATGYVLILADGTHREAVEISFDAHDIGRIREGYICINCLEDLDTAFPDECPVCRFPMRDRQAEVYAKAWQGEKWLGPETSLADERAIMNELRERERINNRGIDVYKPQIIVPRSI